MAMPQVQQNFISRSSYTAKRLLDMYGELQQLNVLWAGAPNFDGLIDQDAIDTIPSFSDSELTTQTLADAEFALATIMGTITNALPALTQLAALP
jgi:hypothetical protein